MALKEVRYHRERARDLVIRLGDGSPDSHARMDRALSLLWRFTGELTAGDRLERDLAARGVIPDPDQVRAAYDADLADALRRRTARRRPIPPCAPAARTACMARRWAICWPRCNGFNAPIPASVGDLMSAAPRPAFIGRRVALASRRAGP